MAKKEGRPTKYKGKETIDHAVKLCAGGAIDEEIAKSLGVAVSTLNEWKDQYPEFSESVREAKEKFDTKNVEVSLLKRATGYRRMIERLDKDGCPVACMEELPPDPSSIFFWLKNRDSARWRDKQELEHSGSFNVTVNVNKKEKPNA